MLKYLFIPIDLALLAWFIFYVMTPLPMWPIKNEECYHLGYMDWFDEFNVKMCCSDSVIDGVDYIKIETRYKPANATDYLDPELYDLVRYEGGVYYSRRLDGETVILYDDLYLGRKWNEKPTVAIGGVGSHYVHEVTSVNDTMTTPGGFFSGVIEVERTEDMGEYNFSFLRSSEKRYYVAGVGRIATKRGTRFHSYLKQ